MNTENYYVCNTFHNIAHDTMCVQYAINKLLL